MTTLTPLGLIAETPADFVADCVTATNEPSLGLILVATIVSLGCLVALCSEAVNSVRQRLNRTK